MSLFLDLSRKNGKTGEEGGGGIFSWETRVAFGKTSSLKLYNVIVREKIYSKTSMTSGTNSLHGTLFSLPPTLPPEEMSVYTSTTSLSDVLIS